MKAPTAGLEACGLGGIGGDQFVVVGIDQAPGLNLKGFDRTRHRCTQGSAGPGIGVELCVTNDELPVDEQVFDAA